MKYRAPNTDSRSWGFTHTVDLVMLAPGLYEEPKSGVRIIRDEPGVWVAYDPKLRDAVLNRASPESGPARRGVFHREEYLVARGSRLVLAACYLTRYLNDRAAGTLGARSRYGFHGDSRDIPR